MAWDEEEDTQRYKVVINHEEQYSIWPPDRENPRGWKDVGKQGTKQQCLERRLPLGPGTPANGEGRSQGDTHCSAPGGCTQLSAVA